MREAAVETLSWYFALCDVPAPDEAPVTLRELFTEDAVWEGLGPEYEGRFGRAEGRDAVLSMLSGHLPPYGTFRRNAHLLGQGVFRGRRGSWPMQQYTEHADGGRELLVARIEAEFHREPGRGPVRISYFSTRRMFRTPLPSGEESPA